VWGCCRISFKILSSWKKVCRVVFSISKSDDQLCRFFSRVWEKEVKNDWDWAGLSNQLVSLIFLHSKMVLFPLATVVLYLILDLHRQKAEQSVGG
jgi:hypothetical protein